MNNIAIIGQIQHELQYNQVSNLINGVKELAGEDCHIFCNGSGLFSSAPQLEKQVEMLFSVGVDVLFLGEQAISRTAGRNIIGRNEFNIIRPSNLSRKAPGTGIKKINFHGDEMWLICLSDGSGKIAVSPPAYEVENFFENKNDTLPVFININGTDFRYKEALAWKISRLCDNAVIWGNGSGYPIEEDLSDESCFGSKCFFIPDSGAVYTINTIGGLSPDLWWDRNIKKIPLNPNTVFGKLNCDFFVIFSKKTEKKQKILHKSMKI